MDLEKFLLPDTSDLVIKKKKKILPGKAKTRRGKFVYINHQDKLFYRAAQLPGKTFQVYCALLEVAALKKTDEVKLTTTWLESYGVSRKAKYTAMNNLEKAGLIEIIDKGTERRQNPTVRVVGWRS